VNCWASLGTGRASGRDRRYRQAAACASLDPLDVALPVATADTGKLIGAALSALAVVYRPEFSYKKAGIMFLELIPGAKVSGGPFDAPDSAASQARMRAVDALNRRFGHSTVTFAAAGDGGLRRQSPSSSVNPILRVTW
jgi:hypothetical protein